MTFCRDLQVLQSRMKVERDEGAPHEVLRRLAQSAPLRVVSLTQGMEVRSDAMRNSKPCRGGGLAGFSQASARWGERLGQA